MVSRIHAVATLSLSALILGLAPPALASSTWDSTGVDLPGTAAITEAGQSVAINNGGTIVAVGAWEDTSGGKGSVRVYEYSGGSWSQKGSTLSGASNGDYFGNAVALSSDGLTLAVGAPLNNSNAGQVVVYEWSGTAWVIKGAALTGSASNVKFGQSVSLSSDGDIVAVGAPGTTTNTGAVLVYYWNSGISSWVDRGAAIAGAEIAEQAGDSVDLNSDGTVVVLGARLNDDAGADSGQARVYAWNGTAWGQRGADISGDSAGDEFGRSVSINSDGTVIAAGAPKDDDADTDAGHVSVWSFNGTSWSKRGSTIPGDLAQGWFGRAVDLSPDGLSVLVGAPQRDSNAGEVSLWTYESSVWGRTARFPGATTGEKFGSSVARAGDGNTLVAGAPEADTVATNSGLARVFRVIVSPSTPESAPAGTPGIYLHVAGPVGRLAEGSPVYYGADRVATTSTYLLTITNTETSASSRVLASGVVDARGNLEARVRLPALEPGHYDVVFEGKHRGGSGLRLTARLVVGSNGQIAVLGQNIPELW